MSDTTEEVTPALFDHAVRVYDEMLKRSVKEYNLGDELGWSSTERLSEEGDESRDVYEGHLTRLFNELEIANPYYTKIMDALKAQGCVLQLRRGGGVGLSKWQLQFPPDEETFKTFMERKRAPKGKQNILEQRVSDLTRMTNDLQDQIEVLASNFEKLAKKVGSL